MSESADSFPIEAKMVDGSVVRMDLLDTRFSVVTRYGTLVVPPSDVRRIEFGLRTRERSKRPKHDTLFTDGFTIVGKIETDSLAVQTPFFGEQRLSLTALVSLRLIGSGGESFVTIDASKYANGHPIEWFDTEVDVVAGEPLHITATGTIDTWPNRGEDGVYMSTPKGTANKQKVTVSSPGALIGKIDDGKPFAIGEKYNANAAADGRLYLRIVASQWQCESSGEYKVRIAVGASQSDEVRLYGE